MPSEAQITCSASFALSRRRLNGASHSHVAFWDMSLCTIENTLQLHTYNIS